MMNENQPTANPPLWLVMLMAAMAGGMGWGIRGQYGHETGAMIAGLLVSLVLVHLFCPGNSSLPVVRAVALGTIAMGFGGSMTYGQTVGLTHDTPLIGNVAALRWGMLGLAVKGGVWIGFAGLFLGLGLGGKRYRTFEMLLLVMGMLAAVVLGWWLLNSPHDPANQQLPYFYFSDHWRWEPGVPLKHRPEIWGGLLLALASAILYAAVVKKDRLARNLALWGMVGGALGFPLGQSLQAMNAWNPDFYRESFLAPFARHMNWWNMMETSFGAVMGAVLGLGLWINRRKINVTPDSEEQPPPHWLLGGLLALHVFLLGMVEFGSADWVDGLYDLGLMMGLIPLVACIQGRWWPYAQLLPITLLPIAGKTLRMLVYRTENPIDLSVGWLAYFILPLLAAGVFAGWAAGKSARGEEHPAFIRHALLFSTWMYFGLNYAFFDFPWPWTDWGGRTAHGLMFAICALGLSAVCLFFNSANNRWSGSAWKGHKG